jgi:glycosyltransferase involved in cell wall biosynthesis
VAYWNLAHRAIEKDAAGHFVTNGKPLAFFHFSGFDPREPRRLSRHQNRISIEDGSPLAELLDGYARLQFEHGFAVSSEWPYGYMAFESQSFDNGIAFNAILRSLYLQASPEERLRFGDLSRSAGADSFYEWATAPRPEEGRHSRFLEELYRQRPDVRAHYPDPTGLDEEDFLGWATTHGSVEYDFDPRLIRGLNFVPGETERETEVGSEPAASAVRLDVGEGMPTSLHRPPGVNLSGYLRTESGVGAAARGYIRALRALGMPLALNDLSPLAKSRSDDTSVEAFSDDNPYDVNVVCVNADQHFNVKQHLGPQYFSGHYNIGIWQWELPSFPEVWLDRLPEYDEIWVGTSFIANALAPVSPIPVVRLPPPLSIDQVGSRDRGRERLGVRPEETLFLFVFDFRSFFARKNPLAVIEAFRAAFPSHCPVRLVIKCINPEVDHQSFLTMANRAQGHAIDIYGTYWTTLEMRDAMAACDAYVSLHRSEGIGLTIAEAMTAGKTVIATGWSGNMDFMNVGNSFPVPFDLIPLEENIGPYRKGEYWADPSVAAATELMRFVVDNPGAAADRGNKAKRDIAALFSEEAVAILIQKRLIAIGQRKGFATDTQIEPETSVADTQSEPETSVLEEQAAEELTGAFDNGIGFNAILRSLYLQASPEERLRFDDPTRCAGADSFYEWATAPRPQEGRHSRFLEELCRQRPDVQAHYPDATGLDEEDFLRWATTHGSVEHDFDPRLIREPTLEQRLNQIVRLVLPPDAKVLVAQEVGDAVRLESVEPIPFWPMLDEGGAGESLVDANADRVAEELEQLAERGAQFLLIPRTSFQHFGQIQGLRTRLEERNWLIWTDRHCVIHQIWRSGEDYRLPSLTIIGRQLQSLDNLRRQFESAGAEQAAQNTANAGHLTVLERQNETLERQIETLERQIETLEQRLAAQSAATLQTVNLLDRVQRQLPRDS